MRTVYRVDVLSQVTFAILNEFSKFWSGEN